MNKKRKITVIALSVLLVVLVVGATIAFFTNTTTFNNDFKLSKYKTTTTETFESPTNWKPGEEIPKTIVTTNEGTIPAAVRVSYTEKWKDETGAEITPQPTGKVTINLDNTREWVKDGDYYYYKYILDPGETTSSFMKSVTLDPTFGDEQVCKTEGNKEVCESKITGIEGATYTLTIVKETVQADAYKEVWGTNVEIGKKVNPITYVNRQVEGVITTGDLLKIGEEEFYVVSSNNDQTTLLAHYNLNIGNNKNNSVEEGIQHSSIRGWLSSGIKYGNISFSATNYWYDGSNIKSEYGNSYPVYVYDSNSNLYPYIQTYKLYLENKGVTIEEARLLKYEEASSLGCHPYQDEEHKGCENAPSWVSAVSYWLGSAGNNNYIWYIGSDSSSRAYNYDNYGIRPVIVIPTSEI